MKNGRWIAIAILCVAALAAAQPEEAPGAMRGMRGRQMLDLSPEQQARTEQMRIAHAKQTMPIQTDIRVKELELASLWKADKLNAKAIVAKVKEIAEARTKLELARVNHRIEAHNLLTPEQQERARKMLGRGMDGERGMMRGMSRGQHGRDGKGRGRMQGKCGGQCHERGGI